MHVFEIAGGEPRRQLPPKKPGRHRFVAIATYAISEENVQSMYVDDGNQVHLDHENLWDLSVGCIDCEQPMSKNLKKFCDAPEYEG